MQRSRSACSTRLAWLSLSASRVRSAPGRSLLLAAGIAIGVAMGLAVHLINRAAVGEFAASVRNASGDADLQAVGGRAGFAESVYPAIAARADVAAASPLLEIDAVVAGRREPLRVLALDPLRALAIDPLIFGTSPGSAMALLEPDTVALSPAAAASLGLGEGDALRLVVGLDTVALRVVGTLGGSLHGEAAVTDIATAQWRLDRLGQLNRVDVRLRPGADAARAAAEIGSLLPPGASVTTPAARLGASQRLSQAYRVNLNVLALVALFTGGFLVYSAQMLETVRRRQEHALLRVIGLTRRQLVTLVIAEAAVVGAVGATAGVLLGYGVAWVALAWFGGDLGAGQFRGMRPELALAPLAAAGYLALGVATAVAGSLSPAVDAARASPAQALRAGEAESVFARRRSPLAGAALLALGAALAFAPPVGGLPIAGYLSIAALVFGAVGLMPAIAGAVFARLALPSHPAIALSAAQLRAAPGQASVSLASMLASFSLMVAMAIMVSSFRSSVDAWLVGVLPADLYFRTVQGGETAWISAEEEAAISAIAGVERVLFLRSQRLGLDADKPAVLLLARDIDVEQPDALLPLVGERAARPAGGPPPVWVSEALVDLYGHRPGTTIELPLGGRLQRVFVAGVWRDYARQHGSIVMPRSAYVSMTGDTRANDGAIWVRDGESVAAVRERLRALPGAARLEINEPGDIRRISLRVFDRTFAITYLLEAIAILVGLFGLATSIAAIVVARRREFGMLRHVGMTRREIATMVSAEGALVAALGIGAGAVVGGALSLVLIYVVNRQSFHWSMDVHVPWGFLAALAAVTLAAAVVTAWMASRGATAHSAVQAVREDW